MNWSGIHFWRCPHNSILRTQWIFSTWKWNNISAPTLYFFEICKHMSMVISMVSSSWRGIIFMLHCFMFLMDCMFTSLMLLMFHLFVLFMIMMFPLPKMLMIWRLSSMSFLIFRMIMVQRISSRLMPTFFVKFIRIFWYFPSLVMFIIEKITLGISWLYNVPLCSCRWNVDYKNLVLIWTLGGSKIFYEKINYI